MPVSFLSSFVFSKWKIEESPYSIFLSLLFFLSILVIMYEASFLVKRIYRHFKAKRYGINEAMEESFSVSSLKYSFSFLFIFFLFLLIPILRDGETEKHESAQTEGQGNTIGVSEQAFEDEQTKYVSINKDPIELYSYNDSV